MIQRHLLEAQQGVTLRAQGFPLQLMLKMDETRAFTSPCSLKQ